MNYEDSVFLICPEQDHLTPCWVHYKQPSGQKLNRKGLRGEREAFEARLCICERTHEEEEEKDSRGKMPRVQFRE